MSPISLPFALDIVGISIATAALVVLRDVIGLVRTPKLKWAWIGLTGVVLCCIGLLAASALALLGRTPGSSETSSAIVHVLGPGFAFSVALLTRAAARDMLRVADLEQAAGQDPLTGLANRRRFDAALDAEWSCAAREGRPLSLIPVDVDGLKTINDTHGHRAGDDCLRFVARAIGDSLQRAGDLAARFGGDEFSVVLPGTDAAGAAEVAERIRRAVQEVEVSTPIGTVRRQSITASLGCATMLPESVGGSSGPSTLFDAADARLYEAKRAGRNRVGPAPFPACEAVATSIASSAPARAA